jgi:hypothetical protein
MDDTIGSDGFQISDKVVKGIKDVDEQFYKDTLPYTQNYFKCYTERLADVNGRFMGYGYKNSSRVKKFRADRGVNMTDRLYAIAKIKDAAFTDDGTNLFDEMVVDGTISKNDIDTLRKIAQVEGVDTSGLDMPE